MASIPPIWLKMKLRATAVARRMCGALLFDSHVIIAGAAQYAPQTEQNRDPYRIGLDVLAKAWTSVR